MSERDCEWCVFTSSYDALCCGAKSEATWETWYCTRPAGHEGEHIACSPFNDRHDIARWPQSDEAQSND